MVARVRCYGRDVADRQEESGIAPEASVGSDISTASDASLVISISRWEEEALAEVYRRHAGAVYGLARRMLMNVQVAEEVVQDIFLRLWSNPQRFDPDRGSLRSFLRVEEASRRARCPTDRGR
jgi:hypothetical protein